MNKIRSFGSTIACQNDVDYMIKDLVKYEFIMLEWHVKEHKPITKKWQQAKLILSRKIAKLKISQPTLLCITNGRPEYLNHLGWTPIQTLPGQVGRPVM